jgi:drug/metabolite transporter (DMT)-like permease
MNNSKFTPVVFGLLAVALWAAIPAFVKVGSTDESLSYLLVLRFLISSALFIPVLPKIWSKRRQITLSQYLLLSACLGANFYFQGLAMIRLPVSWYLIIFSLSPVLALPFMGVRVGRRTVFGVMLALLGTGMFIDLSEVQSNYGVLPILFVVIGMITWVVYTLMARRLQKTHSSVEVTALTQFCAMTSCSALWIIHGVPTSILTTSNQLAILALGILTPVAYFAFNACLRVLPKFGVVSQYLEPVFGIAIGIAFFHESISALQAVGSVLIVIGSAITESGEAKEVVHAEANASQPNARGLLD